LRLLLEKSEEAGRGVDRQLAGEGEQVIIARDQHRALGRGEGKQVVVSWVDRANRRRPLWIRHDRRGAGQPLEDRRVANDYDGEVAVRGRSGTSLLPAPRRLAEVALSSASARGTEPFGIQLFVPPPALSLPLLLNRSNFQSHPSLAHRKRGYLCTETAKVQAGTKLYERLTVPFDGKSSSLQSGRCGPFCIRN
jgi:hypothetical protein